MTNHLGNVLSVISDRKRTVAGSYVADVQSYSVYYPGGMLMPGRNGGEFYRNSFNGMERDYEISGKGNHFTTYFRMYNPRISRWMSPDPVTHPLYSPYSAFDNNPIYYKDPSGADSEYPNLLPEVEVTAESKGRIASNGLVTPEKDIVIPDFMKKSEQDDKTSYRGYTPNTLQ